MASLCELRYLYKGEISLINIYKIQQSGRYKVIGPQVHFCPSL